MGIFTKSLLFSVGALFLLIAISSAVDGLWGAALGAMVLFTAVAYFGLVGWFASTLKSTASDTKNITGDLRGAIKALAKSESGWRFKVILYGGPAAHLGMLGIRLWQLLK